MEKYSDEMITKKILDSIKEHKERCAEKYIEWFNMYKNEQITEEQFKLIIGVYSEQGILLPSSRYGNLLALALELREWDIADIIMSSERVKTDSISSELDFKNCISATEYLNSIKNNIDDDQKNRIKNLLDKIFRKEHDGLSEEEIIDSYGSISSYIFYKEKGGNPGVRKRRR